MTEILLDLSGCSPSIDYDEALRLCEKLGLIEIMQHGQETYGRLTQTGVNTLYTMLQILGHGAFPENVLKVT